MPPQVGQPLVLGMEAPASPREQDSYEMMRTAWIDGVVGGEFMDQQLVTETEKLLLQRFFIH